MRLCRAGHAPSSFALIFAEICGLAAIRMDRYLYKKNTPEKYLVKAKDDKLSHKKSRSLFTNKSPNRKFQPNLLNWRTWTF